MLLGLWSFIAVGARSLETHRDCMVEERVVPIVLCLFLAEMEADLMTKDEKHSS